MELPALDIDLMQTKGVGSRCYAQTMKDYGVYELDAKPKEGQSLEAVKTLLLMKLSNWKKELRMMG